MHNVQSTKLDVLLKAEDGDGDGPEASNEDGSAIDNGDLEASKESDDDDLVPSNEDGFDINSLFSFTLHFLDLSTLGLKEKVLGRLPLPLFLRQEYDHISALIKKQRRCNKGSVMIDNQWSAWNGSDFVSLSHRI